MAFCKYCQSELNPDSSVCPSCGRDNAELTDDGATQQESVAQDNLPTDGDQADGQTPADQGETDLKSENHTGEESETAEGSGENDTAESESGVIPADADQQVLSPEGAQTPKKKKMKPVAVVAIVAGALLLVAALVVLTFKVIIPKVEKQKTVLAKTSYAGTVDELVPSNNAMNKVVAQIGDETLTNGVFQIYYWMQFYNLMNSYGDYASYLGLDTTKAFADQDSSVPVDEDAAEDATDSQGSEESDSPTMSWEQYFIKSAMDSYKQYTALANAAKENDVALSDEYQTYLDGMDDDLLEAAQKAGMSTAEEYVQASFGTGTSVEDYRTYMQTYLLAATYANTLYNVTGYTEADIEAYYDAKADEYESSGVSKTDQNMINVRHILFKPELDEDSDGDGTMDTSSDAAWTAAKDKAEKLYTQWKENPTEDNFSELATANSEDTGSKENGGLYENVHPGQMVSTFNDWCFDESRKAGDNDLIKSEYGYHIVYFVSQGDTTYWYKTAESDYVKEIYTQRMEDVLDTVDMKVNYKNVLVNSVTDMTSGS